MLLYQKQQICSNYSFLMWDCLQQCTQMVLQIRILNKENNINFGSVYENAVAQELCAHGFEVYYFNKKQNWILLLSMRGSKIAT